MIKKIFSALAVTLLISTAVSGSALADAAAGVCPTDSTTNGSSQNQVLTGVGQTTTDCTGNSEQTLVQAVISTMSLLIGVIAIIMVLVSAVRYVTSGGDSGKVSSAKSTLLYAVIGLIVAALAQFMVHFVLNTASNATTPCSAAQPTIMKDDPACKA